MAKTPTKRTPTVARGAVIERSLVQRYIARQIKTPQISAIAALIALREWLKAQPARTKRKGGIGR